MKTALLPKRVLCVTGMCRVVTRNPPDISRTWAGYPQVTAVRPVEGDAEGVLLGRVGDFWARMKRVPPPMPEGER